MVIDKKGVAPSSSITQVPISAISIPGFECSRVLTALLLPFATAVMKDKGFVFNGKSI